MDVMQMDFVFNKELDVVPGDWSLRLIYSDWLEDQGYEQDAAFQRWLVKHKRHPNRSKRDDGHGYLWWFYAAVLSSEQTTHAGLCGLLDKAMQENLYSRLWDITRHGCEAKLRVALFPCPKEEKR